MADVVDISEEAGYGFGFFHATVGSRRPRLRALLPLFGLAARTLRRLGQPPSLALPYFNLVFRRTR
jgi:hypothetical protein